MPVCRKLLKFGSSTETSYSPAIRRGASKYPLALVTSCCETLVPVLVIFTPAPGRTPSLSRTVPEIVPRVSWALTGTVMRHNSSPAIPTHFCMGSPFVLDDNNSDGQTAALAYATPVAYSAQRAAHRSPALLPASSGLNCDERWCRGRTSRDRHVCHYRRDPH